MTAPEPVPPATPAEARLDAAVRIAEAAGRTALGYFSRRDDLVVESKGVIQDLVSEADREVETEIRAAISAAYPQDGVLGEEHGLEPGTSGWIWVVDPIDGTMPFLSGLPSWCISIGIRGPDGLEAGVVHAPVLRETYAARRGGGATLNGRPIRVDKNATLRSSNVAFGATAKTSAELAGTFVTRMYREGGVLYRNGSGALMLAYVAAGRLAGYYDPLINAWDVYAGIVLVEEAGGVVRYDGSDDMLRGGALYCGTAAVTADLVRFAEGLEE